MCRDIRWRLLGVLEFREGRREGGRWDMIDTMLVTYEFWSYCLLFLCFDDA